MIGDTLNAFVQATTAPITLPDLPFDLASHRPRDDSRLRHGLLCRHGGQVLARADRPRAGRTRYRIRVPLPRSRRCRKAAWHCSFPSRARPLDTLEALRYAKAAGQHILSVINVAESTISRESDVVLSTLAGPEIGVASTKAFTTQLTVLACFAIGRRPVRVARSRPSRRPRCPRRSAKCRPARSMC